MKITAVSDVHCKFNVVQTEQTDVLVCAGDMLSGGTVQEIHKFRRWLEKQPATHKIYIPGNHDRLFQLQPEIAISALGGLTHVLIDQSITIDGVKFYGAPWVSPINGYWAYEFPDHSGRKQNLVWSQIPQDTDVLITHSPPQGILSGPWGCEWLFDRVIKIKPQIHIFGHVHEYGGQFKHFNGTRFYNAAICDERYDVANPPHEIEVLPQ